MFRKIQLFLALKSDFESQILHYLTACHYIFLFTKDNSFFLLCWFLAKNLFDFVSNIRNLTTSVTILSVLEEGARNNNRRKAKIAL